MKAVVAVVEICVVVLEDIKDALVPGVQRMRLNGLGRGNGGEGVYPNIAISVYVDGHDYFKVVKNLFYRLCFGL